MSIHDPTSTLSPRSRRTWTDGACRALSAERRRGVNDDSVTSKVSPRVVGVTRAGTVGWTLHCLVAILMCGMMKVLPLGTPAEASAAWHQSNRASGTSTTSSRSNYEYEEGLSKAYDELPRTGQHAMFPEVEEDRRSAIVPPEELSYMKDIYSQRNEQLHAARMVSGEGKCQSPSSTVVHSYPYRGLQDRHLHFRVHRTADSEDLCHAALRIHLVSSGNLQSTAGYLRRLRGSLLIRLDIFALRPYSNATMLINSQTRTLPSIDSSGWFSLDVTDALSMHSRHSKGDFNLFLMPYVQMYSSGARVRITTGRRHDNHPQLVAYNYVDPDAEDEEFLAALQRVRELQDSAEQGTEQQHQEQEASKENSLYARRRKRAFFFHTQHCKVHRRIVPMSAIGFPHAIIPSQFPMTYCQGSCHHPVVHPIESSVHGRVMALLNVMGSKRQRPRAPQPCCAPRGLLAGLDIIYFWPYGGFTIRYHANMIATACGCD
ncbi:protein 60A-like [Sycon ciliatum]|uniref:protein 60A-like n=1 Tax=Sycon ciliatum TaxID=27933 RepID=UPI0031F64F35